MAANFYSTGKTVPVSFVWDPQREDRSVSLWVEWNGLDFSTYTY
eukprot:gene3619-14852_t